MKRKNILAILLALVMALNFSVTAFAAEGDPVLTQTNAGASLTLKAVLNLPTIDVTISGVSNIIVNPYKQSYTISAGPPAVNSTEPVISVPALITSNSTIAMDIAATPTATNNPNVTLATNSAAADGDGKIMFLFLELRKATDADGTLESGTWTAPASFNADEATTALVQYDSAPKAATLQIPAKSGANSSYAAFKFNGNCGRPAAGQPGWDASVDAITLNVVFTFKPVVS